MQGAAVAAPAAADDRLTQIIDTIRAKLDAGTLTNNDVEVYKKFFTNSRNKAQAIANLFNGEFGAKALEYLDRIETKVEAGQELTPAEKETGKALVHLIDIATDVSEWRVRDIDHRDLFLGVTRFALRKAVGAARGE